MLFIYAKIQYNIEAFRKWKFRGQFSFNFIGTRNRGYGLTKPQSYEVSLVLNNKMKNIVFIHLNIVICLGLVLIELKK